MQREQIAFFDVDHTISRRATALAFVLVCMRRGYIRFWYLLAAPFLFIFYRLFSLKMDFLYEISLPKLYGVSRAEFEDIGREAFEKYLKKNLYPGALKEIETLRKRGIRVILATSTPFEAMYSLALYCGISATDVVATQFAYTDGIFDGKLIGVPVYSRYKCSIIRTFVQRSGSDLQKCSFYSDSIHDLPLLEMVGRPVAANPDHRLRRIARKRGWLIKDFSQCEQ
jgi:HAD-superfamily subfamily IB hydrolase, TIGR01490